MYEKNMQTLHKRLNAGLAMLREHYRVTGIDTGSLESFTVAGRYHEVTQYEIEGVGNLLIMTNPKEGAMQMDTFTITPYYKNLPLFTTDYMYFDDKRMFLNEIYDLVPRKDDLYNGYIARFKKNCAAVADLPDMPMRACWYDDIRPVCAAKVAGLEDDDRIVDLFLKNLAAFIEMEQAAPLLSPEDRVKKWELNYDYARRLVESGGVSTDLFVKSLGAEETKRFYYSVFFAPHRYRPESNNRLTSFFDLKDEAGVTNRRKVAEKQKVIRRLADTDRSKSYEASDNTDNADGIVTVGGKTVGFGIHIFNEDVYPLQSFEIYLRNCDLSGCLDLDGQKDMVFLDIYNNRLSSVRTGALPKMRIFGVQNNRIESLDVTGMPACQGIDAGKNLLRALDVSKNPELVELYVNDNDLTSIDLSANKKLKYFYCHNNRITTLDTRSNPLLRHLNATGAPLREILSLAPQREEKLPLELYAGEGGCVGLKFNPVYNAQWKETGEWQQSYYAYPGEGYSFEGWQDEAGNIINRESVWIDAYGSSRVLKALFRRAEG